MCLPTELLLRFVYNITNIQYNVKQRLVGYFRVKFKRTTRWPTHHLLLQLFAVPEKKNKLNSGGFKPLLSDKHKNSE